MVPILDGDGLLDWVLTVHNYAVAPVPHQVKTLVGHQIA